MISACCKAPVRATMTSARCSGCSRQVTPTTVIRTAVTGGGR